MASASTKRRRFLSASDWHQYLADVRKGTEAPDTLLYDLRCGVYRDIEKLRERPLIVYAVRFIDSQLGPISIDLGDVDGFTDLISAVDESATAVDVLIHSPGGSPEATERIVALLRSRFRDDVQFLVPHSAYSAATMLVLSGNQIVLHSSATLGPIDPQVNGLPARSIRRGFDKIRELLRTEGPEALPAYLPLIEKHSIEILEICDDSLKLSKELVTEWLGRYMFAGTDAGDIIERAVQFFSDYDTHKTHSRPLMFEKLQDLNLKISVADDPLGGLMREAYILLSGFFSTTAFVKVFENSHGLSWGRQFQMIPGGAPREPEAVDR
jgi:Serine dehydrogenase proteinase